MKRSKAYAAKFGYGASGVGKKYRYGEEEEERKRKERERLRLEKESRGIYTIPPESLVGRGLERAAKVPLVGRMPGAAVPTEPIEPTAKTPYELEIEKIIGEAEARKARGEEELKEPLGEFKPSANIQTTPMPDKSFNIYIPMANKTWNISPEEHETIMTGGVGPITEKVREILDWTEEHREMIAMEKGEYATLKEERARVRAYGIPEEGELFIPELVSVPERNLYASTLREAGVESAISAGGAALLLLTAKKAAATGTPKGLMYAAAVAAVVYSANKIFTTFKGEHKEEVSNAWQGFRGIKTGLMQIPTNMNREGGFSPTQARIYLAYATAEINAAEARLTEKFNTEYIADIADADGKLRYIREYQQFILPQIASQIEAAAADPNYQPEPMYFPDYEEEL